MGNRPPYTTLGQSPAIVDVLNEARFVSATDFRVLLTGESGVGKRLLAQFIHENSPRRERRMLSRTCAGVAESHFETELFGLFEKAHGSTLLLAEVDEMGPCVQARLLRFFENGEADVRIISAANCDLLQPNSEQAFSVDLYYRLNVACLQVPPLRERREDISFLLGYYLKTLSEHFRLPLCELDPSAVSALEVYSWPGNIRELHELSQLLALTHAGRVVTAEQLPESIATTCYERITPGPRPRAFRGDAARVTPAPQRRAV
jgi:DNA-binding NtrC family response regulator